MGMSSSPSFVDTEKEFRGAYSKDVFQLLRWSYLPFLKSGVFWIVVGWIGRLLLMGNTLVMGKWIDALRAGSLGSVATEAQRATGDAFFSGWSNEQYFRFLMTISIVGLGLTLLFRISFSRTSVRAISSIYDEVTLRVSRFPVRFFDRTPIGRIVTRFSSDYGNMFRMFGGPLSEFIGIVFDLIATFVLLAVSHWVGVVCYFALLGLNLTIYTHNKQRIRAARRDQSLRRSPGIAHFAETVQGASVIRVFGKAPTFFARFRHLDKLYIDAKFRSIAIGITYAAQMLASTYGIAFLSGVLGLWLISTGYMSAGSVSAIMVLLNLAGGSFQLFFDWMAQLEDAFVGVERMNEYLRMPLEPEAALPATAVFPTGHPSLRGQPAPASRPMPATLELELKDIGFRYAPELPWVLRGLSFKVGAGEKIGIVGRTGAGKTSIFQLLQGYYPYEEGAVLWNGSKIGLAEARRLMLVVPQDPVLLNASVRDNLCLGRPLGDEALLDALRRVGLSEWISRSLSPLDLIIEEKGKNLSQGEKQLLVMARMSLVNAPLVLMDEATSSIDPRTEERLVAAMNEVFVGRTQIIIAHRLSTIESCDRVLWLKDGRVELYERPDAVLAQFRKPSNQDQIGQ
jgi:ABC-type multidrug transport system fused ATPase/permease subunit